MDKQLNLEAADRIIAACRKKANEIGQPMNIAVVDAGANLVAFAAMDGTKLIGNDLVPLVQPGAPLFGIESVGGGKLVVFRGGVLLTDDNGQVVGGVGVGAGSVEEDHDVAAAGAATGCRSWSAAATTTSATCSRAA